MFRDDNGLAQGFGTDKQGTQSAYPHFIQVGRRLVEYQHPGLQRQGSRDGDSLGLTAGQLEDAATQQVLNSTVLCDSSEPASHRIEWDPTVLHAEDNLADDIRVEEAGLGILEDAAHSLGETPHRLLRNRLAVQ